MNDIERTLGHAGVYMAADGSGAGAPRDNDPERSGIELGDMLEMGLESLLMHFRRKPEDKVMGEDHPRNGHTAPDQDRDPSE